ncbi:MAG: DUF134 domain-containing protein [Eubacterium sp.]
MPRPKKCRKVCCLPKNTAFVPLKNDFSDDAVVITIDEYETIRIIDYRGFTQEKCSQYMQIARTTVQQIYNDARKKIATALVEGKSLVISGGDYKLCDGKELYCGCGGCYKHRFPYEKEEKGETK